MSLVFQSFIAMNLIILRNRIGKNLDMDFRPDKERNLESEHLNPSSFTTFLMPDFILLSISTFLILLLFAFALETDFHILLKPFKEC